MAKQNNPVKPVEKTQGQLLAEQLSKSAIDKGLTYDPKILAEIGAGKEADYKGLEKLYPSVEEGFFDPYEDYIDRGTLRGGQYDIETLNQLRAENQSNWEQIGHGIGRVAYNIIPQIIGGFASMVDVPGYFSAEEAANNSIVNWANEWKKEVDQNIFPIYEENPNSSLQLGDFAWWASRGSGLVESVGSFLAQGFGAAKLASTGLKGLSALTRGQQLGRAILGANASKRALQGATALTTSVMLNQSEAVIEATDVFKNTYEERLRLGYSHEEANAAAASAAATTMNLNRINIGLNLTSAAAFLRPFRATRNLLKAGGLPSALKSIAAEGGQEAIEELVNHVASKAGTAKGRGKEYTFENALEDIGTAEGLEAALLGAIGGIAQTGGTKIINKLTGKTSEQANRYQQQQEVINSMKEQGVNMTDAMKDLKDSILFQEKLNKAVEEGDQEAYNNLKDEMFENQALKAFESGTTQILEDLYRTEASRSVEEVGEEHIKNANEAIKNLKVLEQVYNNYEEYNNVDEIFFNRANKIRLDKNIKDTRNLQKEAENELASSVNTIAKNYTFNAEQEVLIKEEGEIKETIKKPYSIPLPYQIQNLEENPGNTPENIATYNKFLKEIQQLPAYQQVNNYNQKIDELENISISLDKELGKITSPEHQAEVEKQKAKEQEIKAALIQVEKSNSISELEELKKLNNEKLNKAINDKIALIKDNQNKELAKKKSDKLVNDFVEKIKKTPEDQLESLREEIESQELSRENKDFLNEEVNRKLNKQVDEDPLASFTQGRTEENINLQEEAYKTTIPKDIPNNNTESKEVEKELEKAIDKVAVDKSTVSGTSESDNIIYDYYRPTEGNNRAAYLSREFNQKSKLNTISREEITNTIENLQVLDPDVLTNGTKITLEVKYDYEGEKYDSKSDTKEKILWSVRELELREKYGENYIYSDEYIDEAPIVAKDENGQEVFYVHDVSWINPQNINADADQLEKDRQILRELRREVIALGTYNTYITYKSFGKLFTTINNEQIDVSEAMPDKKLVLAIGQDNNFKMSDTPSKVLKGGKDAVILNNEPQDGRLYALIPIGAVENVAIPLERKLLSSEAIDSMIKAIEVYLENDEDNPIAKELSSPSSLGIDILDIQGLRKYLSRFVHLINVNKDAGLASFLDVKTEELNSAVPLITVTATGIEFGRPGINDQLAGRGKKAVIISRNFQETSNEQKNEKAKAENLAKLSKLKTHLSKMLSNADKDTLQSKGKTALIDKEGNVRTLPYNEYLKSAFQTNIQSINIGTEESPKWVYTIQPTILFDTSIAEKKTIKKSEPKLPKDLVVSESIEEDALELANYSDITNDQLYGFLDNLIKGIEVPGGITIPIIDRALQIRKERSDLKANEDKSIGTGDLEIDLSEGDINPYGQDINDSIPELTPEQILEQRQEIDDLLIKGLDPRSQQSLISYISSKIIEKSLKQKELTGSGEINTREVFSDIERNFKNAALLYKQNNLPNKAERLNMIVDQFDKVENLTIQYLNLLSTGTVSSINLDDNAFEGGLERTVYNDEWVFTVSSKNTASADLKKFFSFIPNQNEKGTIKNALGFPEIVPFDEVYDTLHEILANKPSDYDTMISHLELYVDKFPWIKSVIEKLESAPEKIQNEFVSDMAKHSIDMRFIMWSKDKNGAYSLQDWSSNASSTEQRLRSIWNSNLKGTNTKSNLVIVDEDSNYVFDQTTVDLLLNQAKEWFNNIPPIGTEEEIKIAINDLSQWLGNFGIVLSNKTYIDLIKGKLQNKGKITWSDIFKSNKGLVKVLAKELEKNKLNTVDESELLNDTVIKNLARLEASNSNNVFSNSFQAGGKTIYSYGNNNFLVNRMRDLTSIDENGNFINNDLIEGLKQISFSQDAIWLNELTSKDEIGSLMKSTLSLNYLSLEALKKKFTKSQDNRKLNNLSTAEHEVAKTAFFFNNSGEVIDGERRRTVRFFYPTMSDKSTMLTIQSLSRELKLDEEGNISKENLELLYTATVLPEIKRIQSKHAENVSGYEPSYFYFIPSLNSLEVNIGDKTLNFRDIVIDKGNIEVVKDQVIDELNRLFKDLVSKKLEDWNKLGIGIKNSFLDKGYMSSIAKGDKDSKVKYAAMDYVYNYLIANSEAFKLFAGDPALYYKKSKKENASINDHLEETFINIGKRLAGDIAPGIELANSAGNKYYQIFLNDKKIDSNNITNSVQSEYFSKIMSDFKKNYSGIEGSDAQEYTTWQEHLYVMKQLGRLTAKQYNTFYNKLSTNKKLTYNELGIILQPIKPVYVGNILSVDNNIDRRIYIKSSSFPLIPQLTSGLEIDKIREALEDFQASKSKETSNGEPITVRASFATANKVGANLSAVNVFDNHGDIVKDFKIKDSNSLLLSRENFRIQQDVPYKREKEEINIGTQERKLLFVNLLDVEIEKGVTGEQLQTEYNNNYKDLFEYAQNKLLQNLGLLELKEEEKNISSLLTIPEINIFNKISDFENISKNYNPIERVKNQKELENEIGQNNLERAYFINKNFDSIIEKLIKNAKINVFFKDENNEFKKCD
jgi:hypothetical protein